MLPPPPEHPVSATVVSVSAAATAAILVRDEMFTISCLRGVIQEALLHGRDFNSRNYARFAGM
jgi:hypothetical protein